MLLLRNRFSCAPSRWSLYEYYYISPCRGGKTSSSLVDHVYGCFQTSWDIVLCLYLLSDEVVMEVNADLKDMLNKEI